ncbi:MAG: hypothetical protein MZW92_62610 [Comamonadaceae bacterium]|nr:hypothetical protein [Comamonadaceae bacterium]
MTGTSIQLSVTPDRTSPPDDHGGHCRCRTKLPRRHRQRALALGGDWCCRPASRPQPIVARRCEAASARRQRHRPRLRRPRRLSSATQRAGRSADERC